MRLNWLRLIALLLSLHFFQTSINAQFSFNCARDTVLPGCPPNLCFTLKTLVPDPHRGATTYAVNSPVINPSCLLAANDPALPGTWSQIEIDDTYSTAFPIGFPFVFFGTTYNDVKISSNGYVTFNTALTGFSHFGILNNGFGLSATTGTPENLPSALYANSIIMGPYHDIDVGVNVTPSGRIEYRGVGVSPYRTWTVNYYRIPLFFGATCNALRENTHQIVLYESTGIVDVNIYDKQICTGWNEGRAMVGLQNAARDVGVMAPGRRASDSPWGSIGMNEKWRFVPVGGTPCFRRVELYDMANTLITTGTSVQLPSGDREVSFPNICPPAGASTQYVIKAFYDKIDDPTVEVFGTDTITVNRTAALAATTATTSATCGFSNGTITVNNVSGGTPGYEYSLDGVTWQTSNVFTGVAAGTYTVYIRDAGNVCSATYQAIVGVVSNLTATTTMAATSCTGINNGSITVTPTIGLAPFNYVIDGGAPVSGGSPYTFTGLTPGNHTITFTDANGCASNSIIVNVTTGAGITGQVSTAVATSCAGATNGSITITSVTGGTAPYEYQLGAGPFQTSNTFTGLAGGTYSITIRDALGCTRTFTRTVINGSSVTATRTLTATSCPAAADGSVTITPTSGTGPYEFSLDGGAFVPGAVPFTFSGLTAGAHNFVVRDLPTGCLSLTINFNIVAGAAINANAVPSATSCFGASNGSVTITPTNGTGPYTFVLDGVTTQTGATSTTFTGLAPGTHTVVVTDNPTGCLSNTITFTITSGAVQAGNLTSSATSCNGASNGSITVTPTNGTAPYTYSLDGAAAVSGPAPYTFTNVPAGTHNIVITNADGCVSGTLITTVIAGPPFVTTLSKTDVLCFASATGTITVTPPASGAPPYEYSLDNITWQSSNIFSGLISGTYTVYYREANGCSGTQTITLTEPPVLSAVAASVPVVCNGQSNGIITVTASGGVAPYEYSIDGGTTWQNSNVFNVAAGSHTIIIRDVNGCTTPQTLTVTEPPVLSAVPVNTNASCNGGNDGTITVNATGGNSTYEYSIDNGATWQTGNIFNVAPGNYAILVRDNLGCTTGFNTTVGLTNDLTFTPQTDPTICESKSVPLQLISNATQYAWSPRLGLSDTTIYNPTANPVVTTQYVVTATLGRCVTTDTVIVNVDAAPIPNAGTDGFICYGQTYPLQASGGTQYLWTPSTYLNNPNSPTPISIPAKDIIYTLTILSDVNGCASLVTDQVRIDVTPPVKVTMFPYDTIGYPGDRFQLLAVPSDPDANIFTWTPTIRLDNPFVNNPTVTIGPIGSDLTYKVTASTIAGCKGEGFVHVKVYTGPDLYVPTGFTPNGDGRNDVFTPFPVGIKSLNYFRVFNRWGQVVFSTSTLHQGWDGRLGGREQSSGTYVWMAEAVSNQGKVITKKGVVTLIR